MKESWDNIENNNKVKEAFESKEFQDAFRKQVEKDTWGNGLPKVYMDNDGWMVHHWEDGRIDKIKYLNNKMEVPVLIENKVFVDDRGIFAPLTFETNKKEPEYLNKTWIQSNISVNPHKWTLRGLHYQKEPFAQTKLVKVITGSIIDFVVDIRKESEEYGKCRFFEVTPNYELYVPKGFAHGFITTEYNTVVQYLVDEKYSQQDEGSILWSSVSNIVNELPIEFNEYFIKISKKDVNCETLESFLKRN